MKQGTALKVFFSLLAIVLLNACAQRKDITPSAEFSSYIKAYTGGVISNQSVIRIELAQDLPLVDLNDLKDNPFKFSPSLNGKSHWINNNTIEFVPNKDELRPGTLYNATFRLGDFIKVKKGLETFEFSFRVQPDNYSIQTSTPLIDTTYLSIEGTIYFSNIIEPDKVKEIFSVSGTEKQNIRIIPTDNVLHYFFALDSVPRKEQDYQATIKIQGKDVGINQEENIEITVPALNEFRLLSAKRIDQPENGIEIAFSSPLDITQELTGLVEIKEVPSTVFQIKGNKIYAYFDENTSGQFNEKLTLNVHKGLKDIKGKQLEASQSLSFGELNIKPQVELLTEAAILPDSKNLLIPFRAVNLYAVDLSVIRIFENNILTFLQNNTLESSNELRRAGRLVYKKTLHLNQDGSKDIHQWNSYSVDLSKLIKQEPGAIYRIYLSFKEEYSAYPCGGETPHPSFELTKLTENQVSESDNSEWDIPQSYFYYNGGTEYDWNLYDWKQRENPCHPSYYMNSSLVAACNVFASNLGLIVKGNSMNKLWITVNNILTTQPIEGADITVYNFQLQVIGTSQSNKDGFAEINPNGVPFIVKASKNNENAYLRVVAGENQSTSRFDTGGKKIEKGLKGFVFGERGVWRPGDTLHLSFILEDKAKRIPDTHPVTLEMYNPRGQFHSKQVSTQGLNGFYTFAVATHSDDPTGLWNAYVKIGGSTFHKSLRIETVKPNRLKINVKMPQNILQSASQQTPVTLTSAWLTGATASYLKAKMEMSLSKVKTQFSRYEHYIFNNPATEFTTQKIDVFDGQLDANGQTSFMLKLPDASTAPGMLNATLVTRVYEPGGDASIYTQTLPFSPFTAYVGLNLNQSENKCIETDKEHRFDIVTLTPEGKPIDRKDIEYRIYRIDWSWWWENRQESFGTYVNNSTITPISSGNLQTHDGKASFTFRVNYPEWGRYLVYVKDKESGHATGGTVYIDWPEWRGRSTKADPSNLKMLTFSLDKKSYKPGDKATAFIPAAAGGRALVAIENGSTVLKREWIAISDKEDTKYTFDITPEMAPNAYLHITLLQPHAQTVNDLPIRMYGVTPVMVTDPTTVLHPQIEMVSSLRPETDFHITISEKNDKPMTYILAIVDEGLLDLTNFKTPNPWNEFYAREALGISTWDIYDNILGAYAGQYAAIFSTGGDEMLKPADAKANRFKPVVKFIGPFYINKGAKKVHTLHLPQYVGSVRVMVVAREGTAYGCTEKTVPVRTPLMLLPSLPRVLSTGEEISIPVNVFAMEKDVKDVTLSLQTETGTDISLQGMNQQVLHFKEPGDQLAYFTIKTGKQTGKVNLHFTAIGGAHKTQESIEIDVRNPNPSITQHETRWIAPGQETEISYNPVGENATAYLETSRIPLPDLTRRLDFLYSYTHLCTEQITSKALPLLFINLFKTIDKAETTRIQTNVQESIRQLYARQLPNGGFAYWPGNATADEWITSYAGMFLTLATEKGYAVNQSTLEKWKRFQRSNAQNWRQNDYTSTNLNVASSIQQAFRLYTLALAGTAELGAMNRLKEQNDLPIQARWTLAAAYALSGKEEAAGELIFNLPTITSTNTTWSTVYGSPLRDEALVLETLLLTHRKEQAMQQARRISEALRNETSFSTQSTAFALMAMGKLAEEVSGSLHYTWSLNGKTQPEVNSAKAVYLHALPTTDKGSIRVKNQGDGALGVELVTRLQPIEDNQPAQANGLQLNVTYTDMNGKPLSVTNLQQGTDFIAVVTVANVSTSDIVNLALTHILPSGWEIFNERLNAKPTAESYTYQDLRDDRILTYFNLKKGERKQFNVRLQATYAGHFILPAIQCEAMYDTHIQARTHAGKVIVNRQ